MLLVLVLLLIHSSSGFLLTVASPGQVLVAPGAPVTLLCAVDDDYEWCRWFHPSERFCDFEWKRSQNNITMQECHIKERITFHGKYDDRECGITFTATEEDRGIWRCELEEYVTGWSRGYGRIQKAQLNVTVNTPTTPATVMTTQSTVATTTVTTEKVEKEKAINTPTPDIISTGIPAPQVDKNDITNDGTSLTLLLVLISGSILIIVMGVLCVTYYRKQKKTSSASVVYERDAMMNSDQAILVSSSGTNLAFHSDNENNGSLHEFFPPILAATAEA